MQSKNIGLQGAIIKQVKSIFPIKILTLNSDNLCILLILFSFILGLSLANVSYLKKYYFYLQNAELCLGIGAKISFIPLKQAINDILMGVVFFIIGLEIKNSYRTGELANHKELMAAFLSGLCGISVALAVFFLIYQESQYASISTAGLETDTTIVLFVLRALGKNLPKSIYGFICLITIMDDLIGMFLFNYFHASHIHYGWLNTGLIALLVVAGLNVMNSRSKLIFILFISIAWIGFELSGFHGTFPALIAGLLIPSKPKIGYQKLKSEINQLPDILNWEQNNTPQWKAHQSRTIAKLTRIQQKAHTPSFVFKSYLDVTMAYLLLPFFIFINVGMPINQQVLMDCLTHKFTWALFLALSLGKALGVILGAWLAIKFHIGTLPHKVTFQLFKKISLLFGIGFTFSFFIVEAFIQDPTDIHAAKLAILLASVISLLLGIIALSVKVEIQYPPAEVKFAAPNVEIEPQHKRND